MIYGTEESNGPAKLKVDVFRNGDKKPTDTIWVHNAFYNDRANVVFDYAGSDPWHDNRHTYETLTDDRIEYEDGGIKTVIELKDSSDKMMLYDAMGRNFVMRVRDQYK